MVAGYPAGPPVGGLENPRRRSRKQALPLGLVGLSISNRPFFNTKERDETPQSSGNRRQREGLLSGTPLGDAVISSGAQSGGEPSRRPAQGEGGDSPLQRQKGRSHISCSGTFSHGSRCCWTSHHSDSTDGTCTPWWHALWRLLLKDKNATRKKFPES